MSESLTLAPESVEAIDTRRFVELETTIERGLAEFVEVGRALAEVRDSRLYRDDHATFDDYCRERWGMSRSYAQRTIAASEVAAMLPNGNVPTNEAQARELAPLSGDEEAIVGAWREAQADAEALGTNLSAKIVKNAVRKRVDRIEREAQSETARQKQWTCTDCGTSGRMDAADGIRLTFTGDGCCLCFVCVSRRADKRKQEREAWWDSLSEDERQARIRADVDADERRKLDGSLRTLCNLDGEGSLLDFLREELDALRDGVEAWRHPAQLEALTTFAAQLEDVAGEWREYVEREAQKADA